MSISRAGPTRTASRADRRAGPGVSSSSGFERLGVGDLGVVERRQLAPILSSRGKICRTRSASRSPAGDRLARPSQGPREDRRRPPLVGVEVAVPAAHGQAVGLADRRRPSGSRPGGSGRRPSGGSRAVAGSPSRRRRRGRAGRSSKSLRTTVATPRKWPGRLAPSRTSERPGHLDERRRAGRAGTSSSTVGAKIRSAPAASQSGEVGVEGPGVAREVLGRAELGRVDEDRDDHEPGLGPAALDQPDVPVVQGPHRRDQADDLARRPAPRRTAARTSSIVSTSGITSRPHPRPRGPPVRAVGVVQAGVGDQQVVEDLARRRASWRRSGGRPRPSPGRTRSPGGR